MKSVLFLDDKQSDDSAAIREKAVIHNLNFFHMHSLEEVKSKLSSEEVFAFFLNLDSESEKSAAIVGDLKKEYSNIPLIVLIKSQNKKEAVTLLQKGARACIETPVSPMDLAFQFSKLFADRSETYNPFSLRGEERKIILPNDFALVVQVVKDLVYSTLPTEEKNKYQVILGLNEIVNNAIEHGNLGISFEEKSNALKESVFFELAWERANSPEFKKRVVEVIARVFPDDSRVQYVVRDEGEGFNWKNLPNPRDNVNILKRNGRGIMIAMHAFDEVQFNEKGNEVTLTYFTHKPRKRKTGRN